MSNLSDKTLTELVGLIKSKQIKSEELTSEFITNSQKGKKLNAYITESFDIAKDKAKQFDIKPNFDCLLPGVPLAVKDLFCTNGVKTTAGSKMLKILFQTMSQQLLQIFGMKEHFCLVN